MPSPLSSAQLELLRLALESGARGIHFGDARDLATLTRAGLLRDIGGGRHVPTEAGRRYGEAVFRRPPPRG